MVIFPESSVELHRATGGITGCVNPDCLPRTTVSSIKVQFHILQPVTQNTNLARGPSFEPLRNH